MLCVLFDGGRNEDGTVTERPRSLEGGGGGHKQVFKKVLVSQLLFVVMNEMQ